MTRDLTGEDQIILDVGINDDGAGGICGDVDPQAASAAAAVSPVPGGVGSVTTAVLMDHVVTAAARSALQGKKKEWKKVKCLRALAFFLHCV